MIAAAWVWGLLGIAAILVLGLAAALALGLLGLPGDFLRRRAQAVTRTRAGRGTELPDEVPEGTPAQVAEQAEENRDP